jgi:chromosome condensin MukBEF MukE localization factor
MYSSMETETELTLADRRLLATAIFRLFDHWRLSEADQLTLLGINAENTSTLHGMREGGLLPSQELADRVRSLLRIYRYLGMLFLQDPSSAKKWMTDSNIRLDGDSPLTKIQRRGAAGIQTVAALLEEQLF